ncbi:DUF6226 family protein [Actinoplanes derwentensis]|uniref:Uncharacterized protein n=1 Tax=Actinoplanes derwentensis TaxID=113562 RepID=A0A1H2CQM4_9ACTN|nr:DUF6226 family protein [Actinoplanes derwentensis]GID83897.1 hypothetical protein Ade03nite_28210 [Actinoplanes derwentensis]SDT72366.1 hypothetical protein SAMN04489716_6391 [Actinoplanes derwentensis]
MVDGTSGTTGTNRFDLLSEAAETLLDNLTERYLVERRENKEPFGLDEALVRTVRLIPRMPTAAPLAVQFTDSGLRLRLGRWWEEPLPACPCDTCDEDPKVTAERLRIHTGALIEGGLWERVRRGLIGSWFETRLIGAGVQADQEGPLSAAGARDARREGFAAPVQWAPWQVRSH